MFIFSVNNGKMSQTTSMVDVCTGNTVASSHEITLNDMEIRDVQKQNLQIDNILCDDFVFCVQCFKITCKYHYIYFLDTMCYLSIEMIIFYHMQQVYITKYCTWIQRRIYGEGERDCVDVAAHARTLYPVNDVILYYFLIKRKISVLINRK